MTDGGHISFILCYNGRGIQSVLTAITHDQSGYKFYENCLKFKNVL